MWNLARVDNRPTMSEWPVRIWSEKEFPPQYAKTALDWAVAGFSAYDFVYATKRRTSARSFDYLFGYGQDKLIYMRESPAIKGKDPGGELQVTELQRSQLIQARTRRELVDAEIIVEFWAEGEKRELHLPYVASVYYLYDPFLNWLLGREKEFMPALAEKKCPRPEKLYRESLAMFNYSLAAYRLGDGFSEYEYASAQHRSKWMPWKKFLEEWLTVPMERGTFTLHTFKYLLECCYEIRQ